jgi:hypothetical protein
MMACHSTSVWRLVFNLTAMKLVMIVLFASLMTVGARAQRMEMLACAEKTAIGHSWSVRAGLSTRYIIQPGFFFQSSVNDSPEPVIVKQTTIGGYIFVSLLTTERMQFGGIGFVGLTNEKFVYVTPGVETRIFVTNHIVFNIAAGYRYGYPSVSGGAGIRLLKK